MAPGTRVRRRQLTGDRWFPARLPQLAETSDDATFDGGQVGALGRPRNEARATKNFAIERREHFVGIGRSRPRVENPRMLANLTVLVGTHEYLV